MSVALMFSPLVGAGAAVTASHSTSPIQTSQATNRGDNHRDGWYPDQPLLNPSNVASASFGQTFSTSVNGQVYGQPIVAGGTLIVTTETDWIYGLDPTTGAIKWSRQVGNPFVENPADCTDITPDVGITSTPTADPTTGNVYFVALQQQSDGSLGYWVHLINPISGAEEPNFPVQINGKATNDPTVTFNASEQYQRPGLLYLNHHIYIGFSAHCDFQPYQGWIVGVADTGQVSTLWTDVTGGNSGGGIWQTGGGLSSDGPNQIVVATGNGNPATDPAGTIAGNTPPADLGESVVRLDASDPSQLKATDFFTPYDAATLDNRDLDLGTGSPVILPGSMGTPSTPHLLTAVGKEGYVYLLNRDHLGGVGEGQAAGDAVVSKAGPYGSSLSTIGVWPGDGGYLYDTTSTAGDSSHGNGGQGNLNVLRVTSVNGAATLTRVASAQQPFGFGSSGAIVTSNQTQSGSAVVWVIRSISNDGTNAELQAFQPVPVNGVLPLIGQWPVGTATKFNAPGVAQNHLFIGTRDGHVLGFGMRTSPALAGTGTDFGATPLASSVTRTLSVTAGTALTVLNLHTTTTQFAIGTTTPPAGAGGAIALRAGQTLRIPVTFDPTTGVGGRVDTLVIESDHGGIDLALSGSAVSTGPLLWASTHGLGLGGVITGHSTSAPVNFVNFGTQPLTIKGVTQPSAPFHITGLPTVGSVIPAGHRFTATVSVSSTQVGLPSDSFTVTSTGGSITVALTASIQTAAVLSITPSPSTPVNFGTLSVGTVAARTITIANTGGSVLNIDSVVASGSNEFVNNTVLGSDTPIAPGQSEPINVLFEPQTAGPATETYSVYLLGSLTPTTITLSGTGAGSGVSLPTISSSHGWSMNGSAVDTGCCAVNLTPLQNFEAGSTFWPTAVPSKSMSITYTSNSLNGTGADGTALVLANANDTKPTAVGPPGFGLGFEGIDGYAVVVGDYPEIGAPAPSFIGIAKETDVNTPELNWIATTATAVSTQDIPHQITVSLQNGQLVVYDDGVQVLSAAVSIPPYVLVGFSGSTGGHNNVQTILRLDAQIAGPLTPPSVSVPATLNMGSTPVGTISAPLNLAVANTTSQPATISSLSSSNQAIRLLGETTPIVVPGNTTINLPVAFQPTADGNNTSTISLSVVGGASSSVAVSGTGTGPVGSPPPVSAFGWQANGSASIGSSDLLLTPLGGQLAGSVFERTITSSAATTETFTPHIAGGQGADGLAVVFASPSMPASALGTFGWGIGLAGLPTPLTAVVLSEYAELGAPGPNFVGITDGSAVNVAGRPGLNWLATSALPGSLIRTHDVYSVTTTATSITVKVNGITVLTKTGLNIGPNLRLGFTGGSGLLGDVHAVANLVATAG